jgi:predicted ArsR family transcriptional regulator
MIELADLGFDPEAVVDDQGVTVGFTHCPFRELAEANPDLVCSLHRGLVEGFVSARGGASVREFHDLADRTPCQVEIALSPR